MKDHPDRTARLHLLKHMFAGHSWQTAVIQSGLHISRSTAYRLRQRARDEDKAALVFLDDRHGHPYKLTEEVAHVAGPVLHHQPAGSFQSGPDRAEDHLWGAGQRQSNQPGAGSVWGE